MALPSYIEISEFVTIDHHVDDLNIIKISIYYGCVMSVPPYLQFKYLLQLSSCHLCAQTMCK